MDTKSTVYYYYYYELKVVGIIHENKNFSKVNELT